MRIVFLEATTPELVKRYGSTRRRTRWATDTGARSRPSSASGSCSSRSRPMADLVIDTTGLNVHQLKSRLDRAVRRATPRPPGCRRRSTSFGYKHGLPLDVDIVIDCRFLPNPHWDEELRPLTGLDDAGPRRTCSASRTAGPSSTGSTTCSALLLPAYEKEGKSYLTIAFGCTGGRHRSVAIAEELAARLRRHGLRAAGRPPRPASTDDPAARRAGRRGRSRHGRRDARKGRPT